MHNECDVLVAALTNRCLWRLSPPFLFRFQASTLMRLTHEYYTDPKKHQFVHSFNHSPSSFDFKRMLDSMGHDTSNLPRS